MKKNILYSIFLTLFAIFSFCICYIIADSTINGIRANLKVKEFIKQDATTIEYKNTEYGWNTVIHKIKTDKEIDLDTIKYDEEKMILGNTGDFFIMPESAVSKMLILNSAMTFLFGGHAGMVGYNDNVPALYEAMGGSRTELYVYERDYINSKAMVDLYLPEKRSIVGYRVSASIEERQSAYDFVKGQVGKRYNFLFIFNLINKNISLNRFYCTDLVTRSYDKENNMNYNLDSNNPIYVSIYDLAANRDSYITFFKYIDSNNVIHIYYLSN